MRLSIALLLTLSACSSPEPGLLPDAATPDQWFVMEASVQCPNPSADDDGDGISNELEGCLTARDTDGDKVPDYKDLDSDGDGLKDVDEDRNGDGLLGCCLSTCNAPDALWQKANCPLTHGGCGAGQKCTNGACIPAAAFLCSKGETSPTNKDTFGHGKLDREWNAFICREATKEYPQGRKPVQERKNLVGDWYLALEQDAQYSEIKITGASTKAAAATIDFPKSADDVAGFVLSMTGTSASIQSEHAALLKAIGGAGVGTHTLRASGTQSKSHDKYDQITGTVLDLTPAGGLTTSRVRDSVVAALLGKKLGELSNLPAAFGASNTSRVLRFTTVRRFAFKKDSSGVTLKDSKGNPLDDGDQTQWRLLVMGGVTAKTYYQNPVLRSGFLMDDLSNGTALARTGGTLINACDTMTVSRLPTADVIWVMDESSSMDGKRQDMVNNANNFFTRALASGLDFRMAITGVAAATNSKCLGKFCSKISSNAADDGGTDRFLLPTEQAIFSACMKNPPCAKESNEYSLLNAREAVKRHLPRANNDPGKIRTSATLIIIVVTDEVTHSLSALGYGSKPCPLDTSSQALLDQALQPSLSYFTGVTDPEAAAMYHLIGGVCAQSSSCGAQMNHAHMTLASKLGGQVASICQKNLGNTLQIIIDSVSGQSSPIRFDFVPISSSIAITLDGVQIKRSRTGGFDYRVNGNSLVLINVKYKQGAQIIASYKRWKDQSP